MGMPASIGVPQRADRAAAVVYCVREDEVRFLLVSSSGDRQRLVLPAGGIEHGETAVSAAVREVYEEAGVRVSSPQHIGVYDHVKPNGRMRPTRVVLAEALAGEPSPEGRDVHWLTLEQVDRLRDRLAPGVLPYLQRVAGELRLGVAA